MKIEILKEKEINKIQTLVSGYKMNDFQIYSWFSKEALKIHLFQEILSLFRNKKNIVIAARDIKKIVGLVTLEFLSWDTIHFGTKMAYLKHLIANEDYPQALHIKNQLLNYILTLCKHKKFSHLSSRINIHDISSIHALEINGFRLMDTLVTFAFIRGKHKIPNIRTIYSVRKCEKRDLPRLMEIAKTSFVNDRFHLDPVLSKEKADFLFSEWIKNSFQKNPIFVAVNSSNEAVGFFTYKLYKNLALFTNFKIMGRGLMAVEKKAKGAVISLIKETFRDIIENYDCGEYDTRLTNREVVNIFRRLNLDFIRSKYTFHKWI